MSKCFTIFAAILLAITSLVPSSGSVQAQTRHVYLEEFTGSWCGYCPRGAYADQKLDEKYGDQVAIVSIHGPFTPGTKEDPMQTAQGDSMLSGIGFPVAEGYSFPGGWTARTPVGTGTTWNADPTAWIHPLDPFVTSTTPGYADALIGTTAAATVSLQDVTFDVNTHMVTAKVSTTFGSAMTGDFRLNIMVTEDSVTGPTGTPYTMQDYDQTNYYYQCTQLGDASNPFFNMGSGKACDGEINGWVHRHVFRQAVAGITGAKGIIPGTTAPGTAYTQTFSFPLPLNVIDPNHVRLVAIVHQYSATDINKNTVFDAAVARLTNANIVSVPNQIDVSADNGPYLYAHANGDTSTSLTLQNNGSTAVTVNMSLVTGTLPTGWSLSFNPASVSLPVGAAKTVQAIIHAPEQSAYVVPTLQFIPLIPGEYMGGSTMQLGALSDNTQVAVYSFSSIDAASVQGMPQALQLHTAYMPLSSDILNAFDPTSPDSKVMLGVFNNDAILDGGEANGVPSNIQTIMDMLAEGKRIYISSNDAMAWAFVGNASTETGMAQSFFLDTCGITWRSNKSRVNSNNQYVSFRIDGTTDPIGAGMTNLTANSSGSLAGDAETPLFNVPSGSPSTALFYVDNTKASNVSLKAQTAAGNRIVYMGFALNSLTNQVKADTIFNRSITWLMQGMPTSSGTLSVPTSVDFGSVAVGKSSTQSVTFRNTTSSDIVVQSITLGTNSSSFSLGTVSTPLTVTAGSSSSVDVTFTPTSAGQQSGSLLLSVGTEGPISIPLSGVGSLSGVPDQFTPSTAFTASPNPFHGSTEIAYTAAAGERDVTFSVVDLLGREVEKLAPKATGDSYSVSFDGSNLAAGTYVIVAHTSTGSHQIRVVNEH